MNVTSARELLGISSGAPTTEEIRGAWRRFAREHHPDVRPGDPVASSRFLAGKEAYESLTGVRSRTAATRSATTIGATIDPGVYRPSSRPGHVLRGADAAAAHPYAFSHVTLREWRA